MCFLTPSFLKKRDIRIKFIFLKKLFLLLTFFTIQFLCSQQNDFVEININAQVLDYESQSGIQFSEVTFLNKNIGSLTDDEGNFSFN